MWVSWKLWHQIESEKEIEGTYQKKDKEAYTKKFKKEDSDEVFKHCLGKVCSRFIKKYDTRKIKGLYENRSPKIQVRLC